MPQDQDPKTRLEAEIAAIEVVAEQQSDGKPLRALLWNLQAAARDFLISFDILKADLEAANAKNARLQKIKKTHRVQITRMTAVVREVRKQNAKLRERLDCIDNNRLDLEQEFIQEMSAAYKGTERHIESNAQLYSAMPPVPRWMLDPGPPMTDELPRKYRWEKYPPKGGEE